MAAASAAALGAKLPGADLARLIAQRIACAAGLGGDCLGLPDAELVAEYGPELAAAVRRHTPTLAYEEGMRALPVDFRRCRSDPCSMGADAGRVTAAEGGEPVTLFVHVIDCRAGGEEAERDRYDCSGARAGRLYMQFWAYYPNSRSWAAVPGRRRIPPRRLGVIPAAARAGGAGRQGQQPPRLQLRRRLELVAVGCGDRQAQRVGPRPWPLLRLRRQPRRPRVRAAGSAPPLDPWPPRPPDPRRGDRPRAVAQDRVRGNAAVAQAGLPGSRVRGDGLTTDRARRPCRSGVPARPAPPASGSGGGRRRRTSRTARAGGS